MWYPVGYLEPENFREDELCRSLGLRGQRRHPDMIGPAVELAFENWCGQALQSANCYRALTNCSAKLVKIDGGGAVEKG